MDYLLNPPVSRKKTDLDLRINRITKKVSLHEVLLRQLGMFSDTDEQLKIGQEIISNIDKNGYLKASVEEMASILNTSAEKVEDTLRLIQQFEPPGVGARTLKECLLIQLDLLNEDDPLIRKIVDSHLEELAKKNYALIARSLKEPLENIMPLIKKILRLNPKPGANYSLDEIERVIPDIVVTEKENGALEIDINSENLARLKINKTYIEMLKNNELDEKTKEFLTNKLRKAVELLRAISKRQSTLRRVVEAVLDVQKEALKEDISQLKPLTLKEIAQKLNLHESTVSRVVMNKYVQTPYGIIALKDFFSSHIHDKNGQAVSSSQVKSLIRELIEREDKKHPLSDQDISNLLLKQNNLNIARRTVAKYREELKILPTSLRKER